MPRFHEPLCLQPKEQIPGPRMRIGKGRFVRQPEAVAALLVNMEIEWNARLLQRRGEFERVLHLDRLVLPRVPDEAGRSLLRHLELVRKKFDQLWVRILSEEIVLGSLMREWPHADDRITEHTQGRTAALALDRIFGIRFAGIKMRQRRGSKMSAGG